MLSSTFESLLLFYLKFTNLWPKILPRSPFYFQLCWCYSRVCNQAVKRGSLADVTYQVPHKQWIDAITSLALWVSYLCQFVVSTCHCTVLYDVILKVPETVGGGLPPKPPGPSRRPPTWPWQAHMPLLLFWNTTLPFIALSLWESYLLWSWQQLLVHPVYVSCADDQRFKFLNDYFYYHFQEYQAGKTPIVLPYPWPLKIKKMAKAKCSKPIVLPHI